jgi:predicted metallo-beta-lactamase superfamily hydrolase
MFAPDVQGPIASQTLELIQATCPKVIMVGGPPFYLSSFKVSEEQLQFGLKNLASLVTTVPITILEHHALRDETWQQKAQRVYEAANQAGHKVMTAAEFAGERDVFLEARRKQLFEDAPPSKEFQQWMRLDAMKKSKQKPPL